MWWNTVTQGGKVKGKLANRVGSQYSSHYLSEYGVSNITTTDAHTSAASSWLNWRPPAGLNGLVPFRRKTKSGFCACDITFQLASTYTNHATWHWSGLLMGESPFRHLFPEWFHSYWRFTLVRNFPPQLAYLEFPKILTTVVYAVRRWPKHR
jgi:hypothetical protein